MSQNVQILRHLQSGSTLTPIDALSLFGSFRLGARIFELKEQGHKIETMTVRKNGKNFACYYMATDKKSLSERVGL